MVKTLKAFLIYVLAILLSMVYMYLSSCKPVQEIQVQAKTWTLVKKETTVRYVDGCVYEYRWLVWETSDHELRYELVSIENADHFLIGTTIVNREPK
jgi:uncharacterized protein YpmB